MTDLAELLRAKRSEIVERWLRRIAREPNHVDLSAAELRDHLPIFFDQLVEALTDGAQAKADQSRITASQHGEQRLHAGFNVDEVVREYDLLGDTILERADAERVVVSIVQTRVLLQRLAAGRAEAVAAYVRRRDEEAQRETSEHLSFVAHELRNPLSAAALATTGLRRTLPDGRLVDMLHRSVTRMRELVDQVLTAARFPKVQLRVERLAIRDVLAQAIEEIEPKAEHKGIRITLDVDEKLSVEGDRRLLHSVAANLIGNAVKFSAPGRRVVVRGRRDNDHAVVEFEDGCDGLPEGSPQDLFQPYVQRGKDQSGLGLGLAIVKQAVEAHGGTIEVTNVPTVGCVFRIRLPSAPTS
jgi:signal transduction histidine kinase